MDDLAPPLIALVVILGVLVYLTRRAGDPGGEQSPAADSISKVGHASATGSIVLSAIVAAGLAVISAIEGIWESAALGLVWCLSMSACAVWQHRRRNS